MMNERPPQENKSGWKWVAIVLLFLFVLLLTCITSAIWGGFIGYAIGQRRDHREMHYDWDYDPYEMPPRMPMPDMPDTPYLEGLPWLGVSFVMGPDGAQITSVVPGSPAAEEGLEVDDIITEVDGISVTEGRPLDELILTYEPGDRVDLTVIRDRRERTIRVRLATRMRGEMPWLPEGLPAEPLIVPDYQG